MATKPKALPSAEEIEEMDVATLDEIIERAHSARTKKVESAKQEKLAEVRAIVEQYGLSPDDVFPPAKAGKTRATAEVKYRGPNGETWTGRGRLPNWLVALEAEGRSRDEFLVDKPDVQ